MDSYDIFKMLSEGCKFNKKRFQDDTKRFFKTVKIKQEEKENEVKTEISHEELNNTNSLKRKFNQVDNSKPDEKNTGVVTLLDGLNADEDGSVIKEKKKKKLLPEEKIKKLEQEKINQFRNLHRITAIGSQVPEPVKSFEQLSTEYRVGNDILENIKNSGYKEPTPIQMQAIPIMLMKRQLLACAPTGSGKTAAFLLPIIHHLGGPKKQGFRALILCPTRELAKQTYRECLRLSEGRNFRVHIINKIKQALVQYGPDSSQKFDILITTPKRIIFLLNQEPPALSLKNVEWLIIDEADKLFEDGSRSFKDQLEEITAACTHPNLCRGMFSATNTQVVAKWCKHNMKKLITVTIGHRNSATDLVKQELLFVGSERGKLIAFRNIIQEGLSPPVLVFVQSKERAQELFNELIYDGINVDTIHSDRTQTQRDNVVRSFREGRIWVLICTELMGRGIDFKGVNLVINYDFPPSAISYIHRIGRTGRAGHKGKAITFFTQDDTANLRSIANLMRSSGCEVPEYMLAMKKHSKKEKRKLEKQAVARESISTIVKFKKHRKRKPASENENDTNANETNNEVETGSEFQVEEKLTKKTKPKGTKKKEKKWLEKKKKLAVKKNNSKKKFTNKKQNEVAS